MSSAYIIGAGAQGRITAEVWQAEQPGIRLRFLDDDPALHGTSIGGVAVRGGVDLLAREVQADAVIAVGNNGTRATLAAQLSQPGVRWHTVVHPSAVVMPSASVGGGTVVLAQAVINSGARVGHHVIVNTGAIVEHDSIVEDGASFGPGACMGGRVQIGAGAFISAGVCIAPRVSIGAGTVIGAGAVVAADIPPRVLAYGVPARVIRTIDDSFDFGQLL